MNDTCMSKLLRSYPRVRPPLTEGHEKIYVEEYKINRGGQGTLYKIVSWIEKWGHQKIAECSLRGDILEIGSGSLNHIPFEQAYRNYDCIEPFEDLYVESPQLKTIRQIFRDIVEVPSGRSYSRIISFAVLEHLDNLPVVLARSALHIKRDGVFQAVIPTEGGFLWGVAWRCTTGIAYRIRTGLDYKTLMRHEHVNDAKEITTLVKHFFEDVKICGMPFDGFHFSFHTYIEATGPKNETAQQFLNNTN